MLKTVLEISWLNSGKLYKRLLIESFEDFFFKYFQALLQLKMQGAGASA